MDSSHIPWLISPGLCLHSHLTKNTFIIFSLVLQVAKLQLEDAESELFRCVMAVAEGGSSSRRAVPVTGLVLRGLVGLTDRIVADILQTFKHLR